MINDSARVTHRPWPSRGRAAAAIVVTASLAVPAGALGTGRSSTVRIGSSTGRASALVESTDSRNALAFARCMRSHGVPKYPDPGSRNQTPSGLPKVSLPQLGVSLSRFQATEAACRHLLPSSPQSTPSASQQMLRKMERFAQCMRAHRVSNWPDPEASTPQALALGAPPCMFHLDGLPGLDGRLFSPLITCAMTECQHLTGSPVPYSG